MLSLVKSARKQNLHGYIWQLSTAGFHYEVEVIDHDGDIRYNKQFRLPFEECEQILDDNLTVIAHEDMQAMAYDLNY